MSLDATSEAEKRDPGNEVALDVVHENRDSSGQEIHDIIGK